MKEYETQVLQMSVPIDDNERMFDFSSAVNTAASNNVTKHHPLSTSRNLRYQPSFSLDNISYITKDKTGEF